MNRVAIFVSILIILVACAPSPIMMSYASDGDHQRQLKKIMVFGLIENIPARIDFENEMVYASGKYQLLATNSLSYIPPELGKPLGDIEKTKQTLRERGYDCIITLSIIDIRAPRYIAADENYQPLVYYDRFRNYYYKTYDVVYAPGYLNMNTRYFVETNLYELSGGTLIWSGRSTVFDPLDLDAFSRIFSKALLKELYASGTLTSVN